MTWGMSRILAAGWRLLFLVAMTAAWAVSTDDLCPICQQRHGKTVYGITRRGSEAKILICAACAKLDTACYVCNVPVKDRLTRLADGRLLCEDDARLAVLEQVRAEDLFAEVKRDAQSILSRLGSLPHHNIHLVLETKAHLDKTGGNVISRHDDRLLMGLTRTRRQGDDCHHTIYLLSGLTQDRMKVVAAHEYAHAWLHENVRRKLNQSAVEGFCDWIAWKVIQQKNCPEELKALLASDYSEGQLQAFIAAESRHSFYHVMQWVKSGADPEIEPDKLERILALRDTSAPHAPPMWAFEVPATPRPALTNLTLKGMSETKAGRFALINDNTFALNEQGRVRLGDSNVLLRCVEIRTNAAVVQVQGESAARTLTWERKTP